MKKLVNGINLAIIETTQFQSVKVVVDFYAPFNKETASQRSLLAVLMENSSAAYPDRQAMTTKLNELYGAHYSVSTSRFGRLAKIHLSLKFPNAAIFHDSQLLEKAFAFLAEQIFSPLIIHDQFPDKMFEIEKKNFLTEFLSNFDNKSYKLHDRVLANYFSDANLRVHADGDQALIKHVTNASIVDAYRQMLANDETILTVSGNLPSQKIENLVNKWPIVSQNTINRKNIVYTQAIHELNKISMHEYGDQSLLENAYNFVDYNHLSDQRFTAILFSQLLGGSSQSLLFLSIREKKQLVYYANSLIFGQDGWMLIQAGLDKQNMTAVENEINRQIDKIRQHDFSDRLFSLIKNELITAIVSGQDYQNNTIDREVAGFVSGYKKTTAQTIDLINSVTADQVVAFSKKVIQQTEAVLINED
ncbi:EF-P 5-aminopentanol modification-associated protein YfmF [Oenococcus sicerae]|uniref:EF-P 5-aminopentanol modification-associated protein YfmF n=1 Tax=Oenococcus sicerae TaxID=2203724 RepID=UPI0039ED7872